MPPKILIVEDDLATRVGLQELLASAGYIAVVAGDFREGRRALEQERPDLLIVDLRLQGFNGLQLLHINPRPIPTIVVTGFPDDVLQGDARRLGAEYLVKPVDPAKLLGLVSRLLDREPLAPSAAACRARPSPRICQWRSTPFRPGCSTPALQACGSKFTGRRGRAWRRG